MRVQTVQAARKAQGSCESCGREIGVGTGYRYIKPRYGGKRKRHLDCPPWRPSEMVGGKIATAYAAQEAGHDALDTIDTGITFEDVDTFLEEVSTVLNDVAGGATDCASEYQDGIDNLPENFQNSPSAEDAREKIDALESYASDLESWEPDEDAPDAPDVDPTCLHCAGSGTCDVDWAAGEECGEGHGCTAEKCGNCDGTGQDDSDLEDVDTSELVEWAGNVLDNAREAIDALEA